METMNAYPAPQAQMSSTQPLSTPASQESIVSVQSNGSSVPAQSQNGSSLSQFTNYTDPTSPDIENAKSTQQTSPSIATTRAAARTPDIENDDSKGRGMLSPASVTSPVAVNGAKRTASGHVKNTPALPLTPTTAAPAGRRSRAGSMSSTSSRAGELAATLKARLGYAMAKVQNGWEHKTIVEVEQLAAHKVSPNRHSMSHVDYGMRPLSAGLSNGTARLSMYESYGPPQTDGIASPPSKRRSGTYDTLLSSSGYAPAPHLQPAADIRPMSSSQSYYSAPSRHHGPYSSAMSPPQTPINGAPRRPPTIRTDTQTAEAERDALQALFQLGSPHTYQLSRQPSLAAEKRVPYASKGDIRTERERQQRARIQYWKFALTSFGTV
ncbi:hypothetical protein BAUCODRAFT_122613 [Baudoinia panamericana UAMH 10762]|uniref:Uncharacterized protein n=1 Tax=Baudoinia panamericana (strain UAMH 10762) TaxID=717646 RepID=M2NCK9_BAUPA|nr:uncharacterized protein BAUCODRAFT_122613 [Baudoinia panamericana UAMH 10762]EMC96630.1 hypothetical protein BAUCODRAFT_122613 [Baudoinia panamericana UAMH 10762]